MLVHTGCGVERGGRRGDARMHVCIHGRRYVHAHMYVRVHALILYVHGTRDIHSFVSTVEEVDGRVPVYI